MTYRIFINIYAQSLLDNNLIYSFISSPNCSNIVITNLPLIVAFGHLICLGFANYFNVNQVYSSHKSGKEACIKRIRKRFGLSNRCTYVIIGGKEEVDIASKMNIPFWRTSKSEGPKQLSSLHKALKDRLLI